MENESILIRHEVVYFMVEYAKNKIFLTVQQTWMFLLDDWVRIRCIKESDSQNLQQYAFLVPGFNEENFPFIAVCGKENLSLFNVKECSSETLIN